MKAARDCPEKASSPPRQVSSSEVLTFESQPAYGLDLRGSHPLQKKASAGPWEVFYFLLDSLSSPDSSDRTRVGTE